MVGFYVILAFALIVGGFFIGIVVGKNRADSKLKTKLKALQDKFDTLVEAVTDGKGLPVKEVEKIVKQRVEVPVEVVKYKYKYVYPENCGIANCKGKRTISCRQGSCARHCNAYCPVACAMLY